MILVPFPQDHSCYQSVFPLLSSLAQLNIPESIRTTLLADGLVAITCSEVIYA